METRSNHVLVGSVVLLGGVVGPGGTGWGSGPLVALRKRARSATGAVSGSTCSERMLNEPSIGPVSSGAYGVTS